MAEIEINGRIYYTQGDAPVKKQKSTAKDIIAEIDEPGNSPIVDEDPPLPKRKAKKKPVQVPVMEDDSDEDLFAEHKAPAKKKKGGMAVLLVPIIIALAIIVIVVFVLIPKLKAKKATSDNVINSGTEEEFQWDDTTEGGEEFDWGPEGDGSDTDAGTTDDEWTWDGE